MKWFQREVQGIEAEAKRFIDESFKYLRSAEGAFDLLLKFQHIKSRKAGLYGPSYTWLWSLSSMNHGYRKRTCPSSPGKGHKRTNDE